VVQNFSAEDKEQWRELFAFVYGISNCAWYQFVALLKHIITREWHVMLALDKR